MKKPPPRGWFLRMICFDLILGVKYQWFDLLEQTSRVQVGHNFGADCGIKIQQRNRFATSGCATQSKVRDIDAMCAHGCPQCPDDAGDIFVCGVKHMRAHFGVDVDALDLDKPWLAIAEHGTRDGSFAFASDNR